MAAPKEAAVAAPVSQEAEITLGERAFTLRYGWRAFAAIADALGCTVANVEEKMADMPISAISTALWAGMNRYHPGVSLEAVNDLLDDVPMAESQAALKTAMDLFRRSMPQQGEAGAAKSDPQPPAGNRHARRRESSISSKKAAASA